MIRSLQALRQGRWRWAVAFLAGASCVPGFAPTGWFPLPILALAILVSLITDLRSVRAAAWTGFAFGLGLFLFGVGWVYIALHRFGGMPFWLAGPATLLFTAFLSLYPAAACALAASLRQRWQLVAFPAIWALTEWARGWVFTGFPWLSVGYSQVPASPLAGWAPILGVFGVSFFAVLAATGAAFALRKELRKSGLLAFAGSLASGALLTAVSFTEPSGAPVSVTLVQGNVPQDLKFREDTLLRSLVAYREAVANASSRLVILPETALPLLLHEVSPEYLDGLRTLATRNGSDVVTGVFENDPVGSDRYFNSVISLGASESQRYRKHHLVPFGEFIPLKTLLAPVINDWLHIPLSDQTRGPARQRPLAIGGQKVAMNICYEDVFGEEIVRQLPEATLLVNVSNDAWYGESWAAEQHRQISQMRALEAGRWMLRATNTGVTAAIDETGTVRAEVPQFTEGTLVVDAQGRTGATPYVRRGNTPVIALAGMLVLAAVWRGRLRS